MRKILLLMTIFVCMGANAQEEKEFDCYCVVHYVSRGIYHRDFIMIDLPDNKKIDVYLQDKNKKGLKFSNVGDALTYMSQLGWRYIDSYTENDNTCFVLAKKVKTIEEAYKDIKVERTKKD